MARAQLREKSLIDAGHITDRSYTFPRRFEDIVYTGGQAYRDLRSRGPFHIVNIDACGSIAAPQAKHPSRLVDALYRIVELQLELVTGRWLLFVTTDVRPDSIAEETLSSLCEAIFENADTNGVFRDRAVPLLDPEQADIRLAARRAAAKPGTPFLQLFSLGLAKWLLHLARRKEWDVRTHHPTATRRCRRGMRRRPWLVSRLSFYRRFQEFGIDSVLPWWSPLLTRSARTVHYVPPRR